MSVMVEESQNKSSEENVFGQEWEVLEGGRFQWNRSGNGFCRFWALKSGIIRSFLGGVSQGEIKNTLLCSAKQTVFLLNGSLVVSMVKSILAIKSSGSFKNLSYSSVEFCMILICLVTTSSHVIELEEVFLRMVFMYLRCFQRQCQFL